MFKSISTSILMSLLLVLPVNASEGTMKMAKALDKLNAAIQTYAQETNGVLTQKEFDSMEKVMFPVIGENGVEQASVHEYLLYQFDVLRTLAEYGDTVSLMIKEMK